VRSVYGIKGRERRREKKGEMQDGRGWEEESRVSRQSGVSVYCVMTVLAFRKTGLRRECFLIVFL
jgi:hypothetical protein